MSTYYLDFEKPVKDLDNQILELESSQDPNQADLKKLIKLQEKRTAAIEKIYSGLSRWQRVQLARHPNRPYSLDYFQYYSPDFIELHGDRHFMDDPAVVTGLGHFGDRKVAWIGQQKGRNTKENLHRNFGMMRPEGYRKALRVMKLAEKFGLPVITFMDTIGAYPGIGAEERSVQRSLCRDGHGCRSRSRSARSSGGASDQVGDGGKEVGRRSFRRSDDGAGRDLLRCADGGA